MIDLKNLRRELDLQTELDAPPGRVRGHARPAGRGPEAPAHAVRAASRADRRGHTSKSAARRARSSIAALARWRLSLRSFFPFDARRSLTEKDTILLTDFVNTTGDAVFEGTLEQALAVQVGQSPFLNIFSETACAVAQVHGALAGCA